MKWSSVIEEAIHKGEALKLALIDSINPVLISWGEHGRLPSELAVEIHSLAFLALLGLEWWLDFPRCQLRKVEWRLPENGWL